MANYSLVINSKFQPFSFERYLQPYQIYGQAYREQEDALAELSSKANIWDKLTNPETDQRAHSIYSAYAADLERQADELARNGLNPSSRQQMLNMRARYARDITPIEAAYKRREEQIAEQRKLGTKMIYDLDAATTSLDRYLDNPSLSYNSIDRSDLYSRAVTDFGQYAKALADYGNGNRLDGFTKTFVQNYGISKDEARKFITDMRMGKIDEANPTLRAVYDALYNSTGVQNWDSQAAQNRVKETILEGVGAAIGKHTISTYEDKGAIMARQLANSMAQARYQQQLATQAAENQRLRMYDVNPTTYYSASEIAAKNEAVSRELDKWRNAGYFNSDGKLTNKGLKALQYTPATQTGTRYDRHGRELSTHSGGRGNYEFYQWATQHGVTDPSNRQTVNILNKYYSDTRGAISSGQLATGTANFNVYRQRLSSASDRNVVADEIFAAIGADGKIYQAGGVGADGSITRGKGINAEDFAKRVGRDANGEGTSTILHIINSPTTGRSGQQLIELANGEKYLLPAGILGNDTQANLNAANLAVRGAASPAEVATHLNRGNAYLSSILTTTTGTEIKPNDGTVTIDLGQ